MLIAMNDGTYTGGPLDALMVLRNVETGRFHAAFFEEMPFPGPVIPVDRIEAVRLRSKMHHTEGAETFEQALVHLDDLAKKIILPESNIFRDAPRDWDGAPCIRVVLNWRHEEAPNSIQVH